MINFAADGPLGVITLDHPPVNAFDEHDLHAVAGAVDEAAAASDVKVLLVRAEGTRFSAGADIGKLKEWTEQPDGDSKQEAFAAQMQRIFTRIANLPIPSIAAVSGAATGGGLELALACDLRVVGADARLGLTEVRLGLVPGAGGTQRLTQLVGPATALRLMLRGELINGSEAVSLGVAQFVVPTAQVADTAEQLARELASYPKSALVAIKDCVLSVGSNGYHKESQYTRELHNDPSTHALIAEFLKGRR